MPEPWEDPAEQPEAIDEHLPLAGLLAELLASADVQPAGSPAEGESWMEAGAGAPLEAPGSGAGLDPEATLRALDDSGRQYCETEQAQGAPNPLLARLLADEPPSLESFCAVGDAAVSGPPGQGPCPGAAEPASPVAAEEQTGPQVSSPDAASGPKTEASATSEEPSSPVLPEREPDSETASRGEGEEQAPLSSLAGSMETALPASPTPASEAEPSGGAAWLAAGLHPVAPPAGAEAQPQASSPEPVWTGAAAEIRMPPEGAEDLLRELQVSGSPSESEPDEAQPPALATVGAEPAQMAPETSPGSAPVLTPIASQTPGGAAEEDEFELVDAETAGKMLDRLLDAARTAIQSSLSPVIPPEPEARSAEPREAGAAPGASTPPAGSVADRPAAAGPEVVPTAKPPQGGDEQAAAMPTPEGFTGISGTERRSPREDSLQEASPLPPAAALLAMGLPERLRARLEALGNVDQLLSLRAATAPETASVRHRRLLVFRVGPECYGLPMECVREVERVGKVTPVPGAPAFVRGLVNLRGEILPLVDMRLLLRADGAGPSASPRLIVAQAAREEPPLALMVDELNGLAPFEGEQSGEGAHEEGLPPYVRGSIEHRGRRVWRLDAAAVFGLAALEQLADGT